jgi:UDP-2,3-diacylglucosamine hydrolase
LRRTPFSGLLKPMTASDPRCLFISDVHLLPSDGAKTTRFLAFIEEAARRFDRLYILGDLFDYWVGPQHIDLPDYRAVLDGLRALSRTRLRAAFTPGNRDYNGGPEFARAARMEILPARSEIRLGGRSLSLEHGDLLFNRNPHYTAYRRLAGSRGVLRAWSGVPKSLAARIVSALREVSRRETREAPFRTPADLLAPVRPLFEKGIDVIVCGHLHKAAHHTTTVEGRPCDLFILGTWTTGCPRLVYERGAFEMVGE